MLSLFVRWPQLVLALAMRKSKKSSTFCEILAVRYLLECWCARLAGKRLLLEMDSGSCCHNRERGRCAPI